MKTIDFICPACGAQLKTDDSRDFLYCEYCGKKIYIDQENQRISISISNAREAGFEFEHGRMDAQNKQNLELTEKIRNIISKMPVLNSLENQRAILQKEYEDLVYRSPNKALPLKLAAILYFIIVFFIYKSTYRNNGLAIILCVLFSALYLALIFVISSSITKAGMQSIDNKKEKIKQRIEQVTKDIDELERDNDFYLIPHRYRSSECLDYVHSALLSGKATTVYQALDMYDNYKNSMQIIDQNQRQIELQEQQLREIQNLKEEMKNSNDDDDEDNNNGLGKALLVGGAIIAGISLLKDLNDN